MLFQFHWKFFIFGIALWAASGVEATTYGVPADGDLNWALSVAQPGDTIQLEAGAEFEGPFTLPKKSGSGWITLESSAILSLPPSGTRVTPGDVLHMPRLVPRQTGTASDVVISAAAGAHHYKFIGLEIFADRYITNLVRIGDWNETSVASLPHSFIFERCYIAAGIAGARRGIAMNGGAGQVTRKTDGTDDIDWENSTSGIQVVDSYFANIVDKTYESQAVASWNGAGPFRLENNYFEASGENVMFGGGDPSIRNLIPSDIEIIGNHFKKPLEWKTQGYVVKNLFELKNAQRVRIEGNVFENNWIGADQLGYAIVFTPRNQNGRSAWSTVRNVVFAYNTILSAPQGMVILGKDDIRRSERLENVAIRHNLFDLHRPDESGKGRLFQISNGSFNVSIDHNTGLQHRNIIFAYSRANDQFRFTNNLTRHNDCSPNDNNCGIAGDGTNPGNATISKYFPKGEFLQNVMFVGGVAASYTSAQVCGINGFPETEGQVGFATEGYGLDTESPYAGKGVNDSSSCLWNDGDIGADMLQVNAAAQAAVGGVRAITP